jgi:hypothetical protein
MTAHPAEVRRPPVVRISVVVLCLVAMGVGTAWLYWPMRAVLEVGGACAEGGPYVIETPCPDGSTTFLILGVPLWMAGVFIGLVAATIQAPLPVFPGWALLFGALGWNFLDYGLHADPSGNVVASWIVCAIVFWLMALPAVAIFLGGPFLRRKRTGSPTSGTGWIVSYVGLLAAGFWAGTAVVL